MMFGAADPYALVDPSPREFHASLSETNRKMLAQRLEERVNIMAEESRIYGPEANQADPASTPAAPCIQLGSFNAGSADEDEILDWYANWRLPSMSKLPGCLGIRKLNSVSGWAKHAVLYEFESLAARDEHFPLHENAHPEMAAWTDTLVRKLIHAPGSPNVATRLWPPVKTKGAKKKPR